jgi:stage V sporulation protein T
MKGSYIMKTTGIIRRIDDLGRVVIPKEVRRTLMIKEGDPLEIHVHEDMVCYRKYVPESDYINSIKSIIGNLEQDFDINTDTKNELKIKLKEVIGLLNVESE